MINSNLLYGCLEQVKTSERFKRYYSVCLKWVMYLVKTDRKVLSKSVYDALTCQRINDEHNYVHRYTADYARRIYWQFSRLQEWYEENLTPIYLMTLTTSGKNKCIKSAFDVLREGWVKLSAVLRSMRKTNGSIEYLYVYEAHLGKHGTGINLGYPHIHVIIFGKLQDVDIERIKKLWSEKYCIGSYEHGVNIEDVKKHTQVEYLRAYLIKYLQKSMSLDNITPALMVFNAVLWSYYDPGKWTEKKIEFHNGKRRIISTGGGAFRLWGASYNLTKIMKLTKDYLNGERRFYNYLRVDDKKYTSILERLSINSYRKNVLNDNTDVKRV